jgi:hypothetical protein
MGTLGDTVRKTRELSGISQRALARRAGTTQAAISRIERGLEEPGFERFEAIMLSMGWRPSVALAPVGEHREEPRRLLEQARYGTPSQRVAEGLAVVELGRAMKGAGADAGRR